MGSKRQRKQAKRAKKHEKRAQQAERRFDELLRSTALPPWPQPLVSPSLQAAAVAEADDAEADDDAAEVTDRLCRLCGVPGVRSLPLEITPQVIDQHLRSPLRQCGGIGPAQATARPSDNRHAAFKSHLVHSVPLVPVIESYKPIHQRISAPPLTW